MSTKASEDASRRVAEGARQTEWNSRGFLKEIFLGGFHFDWIDPFPSTEIRPEAQEFLRRYRDFLEHEVDSAKIDSEGRYPPRVLARLKELGAFGMKVDKAYGGLGFNAVEYTRAIELTAQYDANILALLSAHQSIGVPQPLALFGTEEQRRRYLPRCAAGAVSAFALTEAGVGSDPAQVVTTARKTPEGDYVLSGEKLWCTNGTIAELFVVMAKDPDTDRISAFIVEASFPGVEVVRRCHFMGLRAIENGIIRFNEVRVPAENLVGHEGEGLKIALVTLNTGRLSLPAACVGMSKRCAEIVRHWSNERVQWGKPIGRHEAVAHKIAEILASTYAMESLTLLSSELSMREGYDIRLEAAAAKEWATVRAFDVVNETMQIRGGRGYETEASLAARGEPAYPVERMLRDCRINLIFEGSSEIMHLFMAREAVDRHLEVAGVFIDPKASLASRIRALPRIALFYLSWYPLLWIRRKFWSRRSYGELATFLRFCEASSRRLARSIFHGMLVFQAKLEQRQAFLFRVVDIANEIFAMSAAISRARHLAKTEHPGAQSAAELAMQFCTTSQRTVERLFSALFHNDDAQTTLFARQVLEGRHRWLELIYANERTPVAGGLPEESQFPAARKGQGAAGARAEPAHAARRSA
jgi:alkylation response protein AidB-like acyl-CoA dehydrogenase